jgi:hypothetical protein
MSEDYLIKEKAEAFKYSFKPTSEGLNAFGYTLEIFEKMEFYKKVDSEEGLKESINKIKSGLENTLEGNKSSDTIFAEEFFSIFADQMLEETKRLSIH